MPALKVIATAGREAPRKMQRRLAAIFAADVVGYSRLMEQDEAGTFQRLRAHRQELFEPTIAQHHGRVFKLMGDGLLAEFSSVVDAVECAVVLQAALAGRNLGVGQSQRIDLRMGINLGDVIVEGAAPARAHAAPRHPQGYAAAAGPQGSRQLRRRPAQRRAARMTSSGRL